MTNTLISKMLTGMRNALLARHSYFKIQYSTLVFDILKIIEKRGQVSDICLITELNNKKFIKVTLCYRDEHLTIPSISKILQISKPSMRIYSSYKDFIKLFPILSDETSIAIISTSAGIMDHKKAVELKVGGEVICIII